jgi:hypothetical protein
MYPLYSAYNITIYSSLTGTDTHTVVYKYLISFLGNAKYSKFRKLHVDAVYKEEYFLASRFLSTKHCHTS